MESILLPLALLACPVGMGVMMWFMGRGMMGGKRDDATGAPALPDLKAEQARLAEKIEALEGRADVREKAEAR